MTRFISTYIAASNFLFQQKKKRRNERNETVDFFTALTPEEAHELEHGSELSSQALTRLSQQTGLPVDECRRQVDLFLYWRQKSVSHPSSDLSNNPPHDLS
jgi:hypothetical protein